MSKRKRSSTRPHGQLRRSQLITTFGPGSMVDLPNYSVLVAGLDHWPRGDEVHEPRLAAKLRARLGVPELTLHLPPEDPEDPHAAPRGITVWQFPEWFIVQEPEQRSGQGATRSRRLVHRRELEKGKYRDEDHRRRSVVPIRFVQACVRGHISDIDWHRYVHGAENPCRRRLWIDERGTSGDVSEIFIRCECRQERGIREAAIPSFQALPMCNGHRPWLGAWARESCDQRSRLLVRTASNAYFPLVISVISLPERNEEVKQAVDQTWDFLEIVETADDLARERRRAKVRDVLEPFSDEEVLAELAVRRGDQPAEQVSVKRSELETLIAPREEIGEDKPHGNFYARSLPREIWDQPWMAPIERVVLVHRLREVAALVSFTRFEPSLPDAEGELEAGVVESSLAVSPVWLPAIENRGEGIFLQFRRDAIEEWLQREAVVQRGQQLLQGFERWQADHPQSRRQFRTLPYIMLHTFAHMLVTSVSLECGYPSSSLRERIYAIPEVGYGILIYTGTTDAEGTLGGLVETGRQIDRHVAAALSRSALCGNDPVCAQHQPQNPHERRFLHGAACHGCLLIAETSCEQHNEFLDRALVIPTVVNHGTEFFPETAPTMALR